MKLPFLLSVPHAGLTVPPEVSHLCVLTQQEIADDGDEGAAEIYYPLRDHVTGFVTADTARAVVDMNRAEDDRRKDGIIKTHTCWDVPVYRPFPSDEIIERLIKEYYRPYHNALTEHAKDVVLGIDCHTMAAEGPPVGPDPGSQRPHICISNADGTCTQKWMDIFKDCFKKAFTTQVYVNNPFKGGFIIKSHSREIPWMQVELSRVTFLSNTDKSRYVLDALQQAFLLLKKDF